MKEHLNQSVADRLREMADELEERSMSLLKFDTQISLQQAVQEVRDIVGKKYELRIEISDDDYDKKKTNVVYKIKEDKSAWRNEATHEGHSLREVLGKVLTKFAPDDVDDLASAMQQLEATPCTSTTTPSGQDPPF